MSPKSNNFPNVDNYLIYQIERERERGKREKNHQTQTVLHNIKTPNLCAVNAIHPGLEMDGSLCNSTITLMLSRTTPSRHRLATPSSYNTHPPQPMQTCKMKQNHRLSCIAIIYKLRVDVQPVPPLKAANLAIKGGGRGREDIPHQRPTSKGVWIFIKVTV